MLIGDPIIPLEDKDFSIEQFHVKVVDRNGDTWKIGDAIYNDDYREVGRVDGFLFDGMCWSIVGKNGKRFESSRYVKFEDDISNVYRDAQLPARAYVDKYHLLDDMDDSEVDVEDIAIKHILKRQKSVLVREYDRRKGDGDGC